MINRAIRTLRWLFLKRAIHSTRILHKEFPNIRIPEGKPELNELSAVYQQYVKEVSSPEMAVSLELSDFILGLCEQNKYKKLLDLGSGFSSFVFRDYAARNPDVKVFSVDDNDDWLNKTREYLTGYSLSLNDMITLNKFVESKESQFDLVLLDLNFVEIRKNYIQFSVDCCKPGGLIIFDDVHKLEYAEEIIKQTASLPVKLFGPKKQTLDRFGRYSFVGVKQGRNA